jgi:hypothetical protein
MPISSSIAAFGTLLKIGDGAGVESFTTIAEVTDISWGGMKVSTAEVTNHGSVSAFKEIVATTVDPGQVKFSVNFLPTATTQAFATGLMRDLTARTKRNFQVVFPTSVPTTWLIAGYVSGFDQKGPVDGKLAADFTIDITGYPAFA